MRALALPGLVILLGFLLRAAGLSAQSIWFDEGWSWHLARLPLGEMATVTAADRSPFLYYALLHFWIDLTGETSFAMRYLSVCADVATVALVMALARALFKKTGSLPVAGLLYAVCPLAVWYAQETRMYALVAVFCMAASYWLWRWLRDPLRLTPLLVSASLLALAIYSHYYAIFLLPAHGLAVLVILVQRSGNWRAYRMTARDRLRKLFRSVGRWMLAASGVIIVLLPWLLFASVGFAYDDGFVFPLNTIDGRFGEWIRAFAGGGLARPLPDWWPIALACSVSIAIGALALRKQWRALVFLLALSLASLLSAIVAVRVIYPYRSVFHPRYLIYAAPFVIILIGGAAQSLPEGLGAVWGTRFHVSKRAGLLAVAGLVPAALLGSLWLPALAANYTDPAVARDNVYAAMAHVVAALVPGDVVVVTRDNYAVQYYLHTRFAEETGRFIAVPSGLHGVLKSDADYVAALNQLNPNRVRLFLWQDGVVDPQKLVESTLWANGYEIGELSFGQIRLPLYQVQQHPLVAVPSEPVDVRFGDRLNLAAFWIRQEAVAGDWFYAVLQWRATQKLDVNYKVFVHVLAADGSTVFQRDKLALSDMMPMTTWKVGETVRDAYAMVTPANLPAGEYRVVAGVYNPDAGAARLHAQSDSLPIIEDSVILGTLRVHKR